jgi:hypothetical protein
VGDKVQFRMESPLSISGYFAFGIGSSMQDAEIFVAYSDDNAEMQLLRKRSTKNVEPQSLAPDFTINLNETSITYSQYITFTRPKTLESGPSLVSGAQSFIWAINKRDKPTANGGIAFHDSYDIVGEVDLFALSSAFVEDASGESTPVFKPKAEDNRKYFAILHGAPFII